MGSSFGKILKVTSWGESHGGGVGVVVDGFPAGFTFPEEAIQNQLTRRRPGQSALTTPRDEKDRLKVFSGVENGVTLGTPISMMILNQDHRPKAYNHLREVFRPSHADYTYQQKYGLRSASGGGRASARETIARVASGALAEEYLRERWGIEIVALVEQVHQIESSVCLERVTRQEVDQSEVRCPDLEAATRMKEEILKVKKEGDSLGGVVTVVARKVPAGWGEPVFDKLEALLAQAMMSLPAVKGFEVGSGFSATRMKGSEHNDPFRMEDGRVVTTTNHSGGIQGGISNGQPVVARVAFKPTSTISKCQDSVTVEGENAPLQASGRHDPCVLPRAVPIVESMMALVLLDCALRQASRSV